MFSVRVASESDPDALLSSFRRVRVPVTYAASQVHVTLCHILLTSTNSPRPRSWTRGLGETLSSPHW